MEGLVCGMGGTVEEDRGKREEKREGRGMRMEEHKFQYHSSVKGYETRRTQSHLTYFFMNNSRVHNKNS